MTADKDALLREALDFLVGPITANLRARITAALAEKPVTEAAGRPEPVAWMLWMPMSGKGVQFTTDAKSVAECNRADIDITPLYGPDLLAYADRMAAENDSLGRKAAENLALAIREAGRAETAERERDAADRAREEQWRLRRETEAERDVAKAALLSERETAERQLAELQEKTQRMVEPQNPCNCVPDGDDGTVAHLCHWHKTTLGKAYRMQNMADSLTVENIAKLPMDKLRLWIAHGIQESAARKRAEEQLAECQEECEEQARLNGMGSEREARLMAQLAELQRKHDGLVSRLREPDEEMYVAFGSASIKDLDRASFRNRIKAMSAVALKGGE